MANELSKAANRLYSHLFNELTPDMIPGASRVEDSVFRIENGDLMLLTEEGKLQYLEGAVLGSPIVPEGGGPGSYVTLDSLGARTNIFYDFENHSLKTEAQGTSTHGLKITDLHVELGQVYQVDPIKLLSE